MEGKETLGAKYEENCLRSDCRLRIQGMSDLFVHEFVDIAWDDIFLDDDRMVPHNGSKRLNDHFTLGENNKRSRREVASFSNNTGGSTTKYVDHGKEKSGISPLSKTRNTMLEKDSWSCKPNGPFATGSDNELIKEASSLACDSTMPLPHGLKSSNRDLNSSELLKHDTILNNNANLVDDSTFNFLIGDAKHTGNDLGFFENAENKDSSDLLYYGWSEIENFDDIDRMFRNDSMLGLEISKEDELSWLSSADDIGGSGDVLKSDAKFPYPDPGEMKTISEKHDFSNGYSLNSFAMANAPIRYKDCSWSSEKSDSYRSSVTGPDIEESKDGFIPPEQGMGFNAKIQPRISTSSDFRSGNAAVTSEHKKHFKLQGRSEGTNKVHCLENGSLALTSDLQNEVMKSHSGLTSDKAFAPVHVRQQQHTPAPDSDSCFDNPMPNIHLKDSLSDPSSINLEQSIVKSETDDLESISPRDLRRASSQLQYRGGFPGPPLTGLVVHGQREKLRSCQGNLSAGHGSLKNGSFAVQASISDPGLVGKHENHCDPQGVSSATAAETGSSNMKESSTMVPDLDDISLEAASFHQLQLVTKQLDLRTKLCIRDSLYRLAQSAEQRRSNPNLNGAFEDEGDAGGGASEAEGTKRCAGFMDMETDTNPVDRSVAHLLFHRPSDSSTTLARDSFPFKSPSAVHGSDSLVSEENVSEA
ncbi:dentin sialophosphoprotein-like protein [Perilla frutescens var. frutescens]|nr:dentin sialophosphoprotein-like protein [Perilla frutescens var. frutescens]